MSNAIYPSASLAGLEFPVTRTVVPPPVLAYPAPSRRVYRARMSTLILYRYSLSYEFLREDQALQEWQILEDFYKARGGGFDSFLFLDPQDSAVASATFGVGNGAATQFQLLRALTSFAEPVFDVVGSPEIRKAGVLQTSPANYSISSSGLVTFTAAPGAGEALTWSGSFYRRCYFLNPELGLERFMAGFWRTRRVEFGSEPA